MHEKEDIELRSEEFQEVLSHTPSWILRWGITLVFIILAGLLVGSWFFKYPDTVNAPIVVTTENLPVDVVAKTSGRIASLYVSEKEFVVQNQVLGVLENTAGTEDILYLECLSDSLMAVSVSPDSTNSGFTLGKNLLLGDVQTVYSSFAKANEDLQYFLKTDYHRKKIKVFESQKNVQTKLLSQSLRQLDLSKKQLDISQKIFVTDSSLFVKGVISPLDFETSKATRLQNRQQYENAESGIENQKLAILQLEQQFFDLEQQRNEQFSQLKTAYTNALEQLKAQLKQWEQLYLLRSPIAGNVTFTKYWQNNQNVQAGQAVLTIVPEGNQRIIGKIFLPPARAGKVKTGQTVNVKFDDFPYMEYGMVKVLVTNIALVPIVENNQRNYVLEVQFPGSLVTTYRKTLTFRQQMQGTAEIITEDLRLLERLFYPVKALFKK
jgi:HlyD family secretion protein